MSRGGEQIKVSEIAGLIDQIQAGGGQADYSGLYSEYITKVEISTSGANDYHEAEFGQVFYCGFYDMTTGNIDIKVTLKQSCNLTFDFSQRTTNVPIEKHGESEIIFDNIEIGTKGNMYMCSIFGTGIEKFFCFFISSYYDL